MLQEQQTVNKQRQHQQLLIQLQNIKKSLIGTPQNTNPSLGRAEALVSMVFPAFGIYTITFALFLTNCIVWSAQNLAYESWTEDWKCVLIMFQAKYQPQITYGFQLWRLVLGAFIFSNWKMFILNNFALNMLGYSLEKESFRRFIISFYICIMVGNLASCVFQPPDFLWMGCSSGTIGLLPLELERYMKYRHLPQLRKRLIFLIINFTTNLAININTIVGNKKIDWVSHLVALLMGVLIVFVSSDYTTLPDTISRHKYILRKLAGFICVGTIVGLLITVMARLRVLGIGRQLYGNDSCFN